MWTGEKGEPRLQCALCCEVLAYESLKPVNLQCLSLKDKPSKFFQHNLKELKQGKASLHSATTVNVKALEASYCISHIAQAEKPHIIVKQLDFVPLSNDTVS